MTSDKISISIVIPTYNEEENISRLVQHLIANGKNQLKEVIVVDGGSTDLTTSLAVEAGAKVITSPPGRARQMNLGASKASGDMLYFVHADTIPPSSYVEDITEAYQRGFPMGCYRFKFDSDKWLLKVNAYFTRFDRMMFRGGDQTLFVEHKMFRELEGFDEYYVIMEEYDFLARARKKHPFIVLPKDVFVSARKYEENSYLRVNLANLVVFNLYRLGCKPRFILRTYQKLIAHPKAVKDI